MRVHRVVQLGMEEFATRMLLTWELRQLDFVNGGCEHEGTSGAAEHGGSCDTDAVDMGVATTEHGGSSERGHMRRSRA
eukprot:1141360-Pelagomonas_calceolata.AAC.7